MPDNTRVKLVRDIVQEQHISPTKWNTPPQEEVVKDWHKQANELSEVHDIEILPPNKQPEEWESELNKFAVYMIERYKYSLGEGNEIMNEIHDFILKTKRELLASQRASDVQRLEEEKYEEIVGGIGLPEREQGYNAGIDQAIALLTDK